MQCLCVHVSLQVLGVNSVSCIMFSLMDILPFGRADASAGRDGPPQGGQQSRAPGAMCKAEQQQASQDGWIPEGAGTAQGSCALAVPGGMVRDAGVVFAAVAEEVAAGLEGEPQFQALVLQAMLSKGFGANLPAAVLRSMAAGRKRWVHRGANENAHTHMHKSHTHSCMH